MGPGSPSFRTNCLSEFYWGEEPGRFADDAPGCKGHPPALRHAEHTLGEGQVETAPTLGSMESYVQNWIEDCEYVDENGQEENEGIDEVQEDGQRQASALCRSCDGKAHPSDGQG